MAAIPPRVSPARTAWALVLISARKARPTTARVLELVRRARMECPPLGLRPPSPRTYRRPINPSTPNFHICHRSHTAGSAELAARLGSSLGVQALEARLGCMVHVAHRLGHRSVAGLLRDEP